MVNQSKKTLDTNITKLVNQPYKYGFSTSIEKDIIEKGLNENVIHIISQKKNEPEFLIAIPIKSVQKMERNEVSGMGAIEIFGN